MSQCPRLHRRLRHRQIVERTGPPPTRTVWWSLGLRTARERATDAEITPLDWRVLVAIFEMTASEGQIRIETTAREVAALVYRLEPKEIDGGQRKRVSHSIKHLYDAGCITYLAEVGCQASPLIGLPTSDTVAQAS